MWMDRLDRALRPRYTSQTAADVYQQRPRRIVHGATRSYDTTGLQELRPPGLILEPYVAATYGVYTALLRLRCAESLGDEVQRYKVTYHHWQTKYSNYHTVRNKPLKAVKAIKPRTVKSWLYGTARDQAALQTLRDKLDRCPSAVRKLRVRFERLNTQRWGHCEIAERLVVAKRARMVMRSSNHGSAWCAAEFNRILACPWIWCIVRDYVSEQEGITWASRGAVSRAYVNKIRVQCILVHFRKFAKRFYCTHHDHVHIEITHFRSFPDISTDCCM